MRFQNSRRNKGQAIKTENVTIAGKTCESYKIENAGVITEFAGTQGICLYALQKSKVGNALAQAASIQENVKIPAETFSIPKGFVTK